jgi:HEPN domain-containing protein
MRLKALQALFDAGAYPDVIRESQEAFELVLKGYLRLYKIDPPKWNDVSQLLIENRELFPNEIVVHLDAICEFSRYLRRERENSFYGDDDLIPLQHYDQNIAKDCFDKLQTLIKVFENEFIKS